MSSATVAADRSGREPIPFRRPEGLAIVVHLCGFAGQRDLLTFAGAMEDSPDFDEVSLTRVTDQEAWLTVRAESSSDVVAALHRVPGFDLDVTVDQNLVEARARYRASVGASIGADSEPRTSPSAHPHEPDMLLPSRPRFRAFRPPPLGASDEQVADDLELRTADHQPPPAPQPVPSSARPPAPTREEAETHPAASASATPELLAPDAPEERPRPSSLAPTAPVPTMPSPARVAGPRTEDRTSPRPAAPAPASPIFTSSAPSRLEDAPSSSSNAPAAPDAPPPAAPAPRAPGAPRSRNASPTPDGPASPPQATPAPPIEDDFVEPEDRPGGAVMTVEHLTLVVYPFRSFAMLNEFQAAIRGLHGVKNTRVRRFYRGTLHLAVDYEDMIPLSDRLGDLKEIEFQVASESRSELEIVLQDSSPLAAAGGS